MGNKIICFTTQRYESREGLCRRQILQAWNFGNILVQNWEKLAHYSTNMSLGISLCWHVFYSADLSRIWRDSNTNCLIQDCWNNFNKTGPRLKKKALWLLTQDIKSEYNILSLSIPWQDLTHVYRRWSWFRVIQTLKVQIFLIYVC